MYLCIIHILQIPEAWLWNSRLAPVSNLLFWRGREFHLLQLIFISRVNLSRSWRTIPSKDMKDDASYLEELGDGNGTPPIQLGNAEEKRLLRRVDVQLIPLLSILYLISFLDRAMSAMPA